VPRSWGIRLCVDWILNLMFQEQRRTVCWNQAGDLRFWRIWREINRLDLKDPDPSRRLRWPWEGNKKEDYGGRKYELHGVCSFFSYGLKTDWRREAREADMKFGGIQQWHWLEPFE
jgi:hypothetical protein